jgi:hypothetical protein
MQVTRPYEKAPPPMLGNSGKTGPRTRRGPDARASGRRRRRGRLARKPTQVDPTPAPGHPVPATPSPKPCLGPPPSRRRTAGSTNRVLTSPIHPTGPAPYRPIPPANRPSAGAASPRPEVQAQKAPEEQRWRDHLQHRQNDADNKTRRIGGV